MWILRCAIMVFGGCATLFAPTNGASAKAHFVPHRAFYEIEAQDAHYKLIPIKVRGKVIQDFTETKAAIKSYERSLIHIKVAGLISIDKDVRLTTIESKDGKKLEFQLENFDKDKVSEKLKGVIKLEEGASFAKLERPVAKSLKLEKKVSFPVTFTKELLRRAEAGEKFYKNYSLSFNTEKDLESPIYQMVTIGTSKLYHAHKEDALDKQFDKKYYWPIEITTYQDEKKLDGLPTGKLSFDLFENGVRRNIVIADNTITIKMKLKSLAFPKA